MIRDEKQYERWLFMKNNAIRLTVICMFLLSFFTVCVHGEQLYPYSLPMKQFVSRKALNRYVNGLEEMLEKLDAEIENCRHMFADKELAPVKTVDNCIYNVITKNVYGDDPGYSHSFFEVKEGETYFVSGGSATTYKYYPLGAFYDAAGNILMDFGTKQSHAYQDEEVIAPNQAVTMVVNQNNGSSLEVKSAKYDGSEEKKVYNLLLADEMLHVRSLNPFRFKLFDQGYVTFVFDDLIQDLDSIAAVFEEYGYPMVLAAIPSRIENTAAGLAEKKGSYSPGMLMKDVMKTVVELGGEIMVHNTEPVITESNQYDHDFMYEYFIQAKKDLENAGFSPRGIIRAGGKGAINKSEEIERWLIGNYEYSNMGVSDNYMLERKSINRLAYEVKNDIRFAKESNTWIRFMCHGYAFGNGETFRNERDLRELLDYCRDTGIEVVTYAYMYDHFGSTELTEWGQELSSQTE